MHSTRLAAVAAFALVGSLSTQTLAWGTVRGSGKVVKETREVGKFERVSASSGIAIELTVGPLKAIVLEGEDNILPLVETRVRGGALEVRYRENTSINDSGVTVHVQAPTLSEVDVSGGSSATGEVGKSEEFELDASGGGEIRLRGVDTKELSVELSGGSRAELEGRADTLKAEASGGAKLKASKLAVTKAKVDGSGGSTIALKVSQTVKGDLSGGCSLSVKGEARIKVAASGGSTVNSNGEDITPQDD